MTLTIEVRAKSGKANELYQTLQALLPTMRKARGCQSCRLSPDTGNEDLHTLSCDWDSRAGFEEYIRTGSGSALIGALDLLGESVKVRFSDHENSEGIETMKGIREKY